MVTVPEYRPDVALRPAGQSDFTVRASPEAFGAGVGRGLEQVGRGLGQAAEAMQRVRELEDIARGKEAENDFSRRVNELMYGENGFMTLEGRNAVDGRAAFEKEVERMRMDAGKSLTPGAARAYQVASQARAQSVYQQSIVHTANQRKAWFKNASDARVQTFANDALVNFSNPALVTKNIAAGLLEIREKGGLEGWDADTLALREAEFVSGVHKNIALRLAQGDPLAADAYIKAHAGKLSGAHQYELRTALETEIKNEQSKREADAILGLGRGGVEPAQGRTMGAAGPTAARAFLQSKTGKDATHVDGLNEAFAGNLAAMLQDAPPGIREGLGLYSGYRSNERQAELWADAVKRYGSEAAARKWVAPPGKSFHNSGEAADLSYNGRSLKHAPKEVLDWVHSNAGKYGLYFPMKHEPWHVEPMGTRGSALASGTVAPRTNTVSARALLPSYDDMETRLLKISDPDVRDLTRKRLYSMIEAQAKAAEQREKAAKAELWNYVDQGATPDDVSFEVRQAAGMAAVSSAWSYVEARTARGEVQSDDVLLYDMRRYAAVNPSQFAGVDLNEYRDRLSREAIKELTDLQTGALSDQRKAREEGLNLTAAFSQASSQLDAVGITTAGKSGAEREEAARRIAQFQNALASQMEEFKQANEGRQPTQMDIQSMVNRLLLPIVVRQEKSIWNPTKTPWSATFDTPGLMFEAGSRPDGSDIDVAVEYGDIPLDLRRGIALDLERDLGRKPSEAEVVQRYEDFILGR